VQFAVDGKAKVDNQLYTVEGCIEGLRGHEGFIPQFANNNMRDGAWSMLLQVTGIDDERNDDKVEVGLFYSRDPMAKNGSGTDILSQYTFRVTEEPQYAHYHRRVQGRIVDGVVITEPVEMLRMNLGSFNSPYEPKIVDARMSLQLLPDGNIKGVLAGYEDWRNYMNQYYTSTGEVYKHIHNPGLYNAFKRNADGLKDPVTGVCVGISSAYDIDGVRAFIRQPPPPQVAQASSPVGQGQGGVQTAATAQTTP